MRILLFDTSAHGSPWPLFLQDLKALTKTKTGQYAYRFVDEAPFLEEAIRRHPSPHSRPQRLTINVAQRRARMLAYEAAARFLRYRCHPVRYTDLNRRLLEEAKKFAPQVVLIVMGFHIAQETLHAIKKETGAVLINYAADDPFNERTSPRNVREAIPLYDAYACTKRAMMDDVASAGCGNVQYVRFGYHPSVHFAEAPVTAEERNRFAADVAFVGEGDGDRRPFFRTFLKALPDLDLALYGDL